MNNVIIDNLYNQLIDVGDADVGDAVVGSVVVGSLVVGSGVAIPDNVKLAIQQHAVSSAGLVSTLI